MSQQEYFRHPKVIAKVNGFALRALTVVASEMRSPVNDNVRPSGPSEEEVLEALLQAVCDPDRSRFDQAVAQFLGRGTTAEDIANHHVPTVARALGQAWLDDRLEFASVTIACARLQGYLRTKGLQWAEKASLGRLPTSNVLLVVPDFEQHTLGATLLAGQLRAQGVWVTLQLNVRTDEIERLVAQRKYDAVLISSSRNQTLELLEPFVSNTRNGASNAPIVIGGNVLEQTPDVLSETGADFTAGNWQSALEIFDPKPLQEEADFVGSRERFMSADALRLEPKP